MLDLKETPGKLGVTEFNVGRLKENARYLFRYDRGYTVSLAGQEEMIWSDSATQTFETGIKLLRKTPNKFVMQATEIM